MNNEHEDSVPAGIINVKVLPGGRIDLVPVNGSWPMSYALSRAIADVISPHPDYLAPKPSAPIVGEARAVLASLSERLKPAPECDVMAWLWPLADAVEFPPTEGEFKRRLSALLLVSGDLPAEAWSVEVQKEALRRFDRFPAVARIVALVEEPVRPLLTQARALRVIVGGGA